ncbi:MAG: circadian clock protein KaiB [Acidimicrobiaceae bacterium]|jgi:circadian clock protein KaiB|nr:circadian clock protein KaiB [Acidimicrobiaceae bacterium]
MSASTDSAFGAYEDDRGTSEDAGYDLTLFVSGASELSARAIANAQEVCDIHLPAGYHLSVVDVYGDPAALARGRILAVPALVRNRPLPVRRVVGDLSHIDKVVLALDLPLVERDPEKLG